MSTLTVTTLTLSTAPVGPPNPLPPLAGASGTDLHADVSVGEGVDEEMRRGLDHGHVGSVAPYLLQDDYGRDRVPTEHPVAVLENEHLRATFLLGLGGRLWSLRHLATGRELLYSNPVIQPGNLALRDAWFAGGVEWNLGTTGHTPLTCAPMHAARVDLPDGTPVLRMWEYERLRGVVYQLDAWLPPGARSLLVSVRLTNPQDTDVPTYWWSNIAVPQSDDVRVVAPADAAWKFDYTRRVDRRPMPLDPRGDGTDLSYPARSTVAADYFFDLEDSPRPWVAALDGDGTGLVQSSTRELRGRKLFLWGTGTGGRHWQEWLSPAGGSYLEIQAGLARTQLEHLSQPPRSTWQWLETYGLAEADPRLVHGSWTEARYAVESALDVVAPAAWVTEQASVAAALADLPPSRPLHTGSGWGALERLRGEAVGDVGLDLPGTPFPATTLGPEQRPWLALLGSGQVPEDDPAQAPASLVVADPWRDLLEAAASGAGWAGLLHLGTARWQAGDRDGAVVAWEASLAATPSAWAHRNLAVARRLAGDAAGADAAYGLACGLAPDLAALALERLRALAAHGEDAVVQQVVDALTPAVRAHPEVGLLDARAALRRGDVARAERVLHDGFAWPNLREGATALEDLWWELSAAKMAASEGVPPDATHLARARAEGGLPWALDFRMI